MTCHSPLRRLSMALAALTLLTGTARAEATGAQVFSKDAGPSQAACDGHARGSVGWRVCVGAARAEMSDDELFYAGYWLAKSGRYADALTYLNLSRARDAKVLTYIGFATRKLGQVDQALPFYAAALDRDPDFVVARAYLGEAHLTRGEPQLAREQLDEIAARCGTTCAAYVDLDRHIAAYDKAHG